MLVSSKSKARKKQKVTKSEAGVPQTLGTQLRMQTSAWPRTAWPMKMCCAMSPLTQTTQMTCASQSSCIAAPFFMMSLQNPTVRDSKAVEYEQWKKRVVTKQEADLKAQSDKNKAAAKRNQDRDASDDDRHDAVVATVGPGPVPGSGSGSGAGAGAGSGAGAGARAGAGSAGKVLASDFFDEETSDDDMRGLPAMRQSKLPYAASGKAGSAPKSKATSRKRKRSTGSGTDDES